MNTINKAQTILIVEDSEEDYEAVLRAFKAVHLNNPFFWCKSGRMAMDYLKRDGVFKDEETQIPGLILLDLNMPGIDGHKTLQMIRKDDELRDIPVVILTTSGHDRDITACFTAGANSYIQKPVTFKGLADAIKDMKDFRFELSAIT